MLYKLLKSQREFLEIPHDYSLDVAVYQGGYGSGKTFSGSLLGILLALKFPGVRGLVGAQTYTLVRDTTFNIGEIVPIYTNVLVQPGDTISINLRSFLKLGTSIVPATGNLCVDIFCFADDWQNVWDHTKEFWGEDTLTPFETETEYTIPQLVIAGTDTVDTHDIIHHIALPYMAADETRNNIETSILPLRTYQNIYNEYFRDQNYIEKITISKGDEDTNYTDIANKKLYKAARLHDYFSGIPEAQKGGQSLIPIGTEAPVIGNGNALGITDNLEELQTAWMVGNVGSGGGRTTSANFGLTTPLKIGQNGTDTQMGKDAVAVGVTTNPEYSGLVADLTQTIAGTLNALRLVTAEQHIKESFAWYGARYQNVIYAGWGVGNAVSAAEMRIPEYLGGHRFWLNMDTVLATNGQTDQPLGDSAGYSTTYDEQYLFTKSFSTWHNLMILCVVRQQHVYSQGLQNQFQKKRKFDFYWKEFEGIGAQARKKSEIYLTGTDTDNDVWNFAPAWQEYRFENSRSTGLMAPNAPLNLAVYNYGDYYENVPNAGQEWIEETPVYVDRTLVVPSTTTDQIIANFAFDIEKVSIVKNYVLPGLDKL